MTYPNLSASKLLGGPLPSALVVALGALLASACSSEEASPVAPGSAGTAGTTSAGSTNGGSAAVAGAGGSGSGLGGSPGSAGTAGAGQAGGATGGGGAGGGASGGAGGSTGGGAAGGAGTGGSGGAGGGASGPFLLSSSAFDEGEQIPLKYKCAEVNPVGENQSPPLSWGPGPAGTQSYAIVMRHVPTPEHWVIWDIPSTVTTLPENIEHAAQPAVPAGSKQSFANLDGFTGSGYLGPCPQAVNSVQSYEFTLYALDVATLPGLTATSTPTQAATVVKAHLVGGSQGVSLTGTQIRTP